ncbi:MAG TPA: hypothetical protein VHJ20_06430 [Polyangia bacterium]|nr:hypothetical protein [Polyangia bacterium]
MSDELQFETAEFASATAGKTCVVCKSRITDTYFAVMGNVLCERCAARFSDATGGAEVFARAALLGAGAALAGTLAWYLLIRIAKIELGIVAVAVGYFVGKMVRRGAGGRGGWRYQTLAVVLTYASIVTSYALLALGSVPADAHVDALRLVAFAVTAPFTGGASNIMGIVIIGIALYQAWKFNQRVPIVGPYRIAAPPVAGEPPPGPPPVSP